MEFRQKSLLYLSSDLPPHLRYWSLEIKTNKRAGNYRVVAVFPAFLFKQKQMATRKYTKHGETPEPRTKCSENGITAYCNKCCKEYVRENIINARVVRKLNRVGEKYTTNQGYEIEIIEYFGSENITARFETGLIVYKLNFVNIKRGEVNNPYHPTICGIGYTGVGDHKPTDGKKLTRSYQKWLDMIGRCYSKKRLIRYPSYAECSVIEEWHNFQVFAEWFEKSYTEDWYLDKDILTKGNKVYSPETCVFVPEEINNLFVKSNKTRGFLPIGVCRDKKTFKAQISRYNSTEVLGVFDTPEEAFIVYKEAKEEYIKEVADKWKPEITPETYDAMYNYKVEITD